MEDDERLVPVVMTSVGGGLDVEVKTSTKVEPSDVTNVLLVIRVGGGVLVETMIVV